MEHAVPLPQYIFFDLFGAGADLRCFSPAPAVEHIGVPYDTQVMCLEALHRTRLSRTGLATRPDQVGKTRMVCDHAQISDPDTVSDAGTPDAQLVEETGDESEDEAVSLEELSYDESFTRKIDALAELVGMEGNLEPAVVLGEVVRVLQEMERKTEHFVCATRAI